MTAESTTEIIEGVIGDINTARASAGYRPMSIRGQDPLRRTTQNILTNLESFASDGAIEASFRQDFTRDVQSYYRDEWYTVDTQTGSRSGSWRPAEGRHAMNGRSWWSSGSATCPERSSPVH